MEEKEYCCSNGYIKHAGAHLILEFWRGKNFASLAKIEKILRDSVRACRATSLKIGLHKFIPSSHVSEIAFIQESHISIRKGISKNINPDGDI